MTLLDEYPYPGKYEGELNLTAKLDSDGFPDQEIGEVEFFGYYALYTNLHVDPELAELAGSDIAAAILNTSSLGFVSATYYRTYDEAMSDWQELEKDYERFLESEE